MPKCEQKFLFYFSLGCIKICAVLTRGGVEDTRLEAKAKAKDTKKNPRPRTGMLEAKAKVQGQSRKCSPKKKKGLQKSFSGNLQFFGVARIFDWGAQTTNHVQQRHQRFSNEEIFVG